VILLDTSGILAAVGADERRHEECARVLRAADPPRLLSPFVLAEVDYMIHKYAGARAALAFLDEVGRRAYELVPMEHRDVDYARSIMEHYRELEIGLTDASIVALAARYSCWDVLTLDKRHFRAIKIPGVKRRFRILPAEF
jgi:hypothetical protein